MEPGSFPFRRKPDLVRELQAELEGMDERIVRLENETRIPGVPRTEDTEDALMELYRKKDAAADAFRDVQASGREAWAPALSRMDEAMRLLRESYDRAASPSQK